MRERNDAITEWEPRACNWVVDQRPAWSGLQEWGKASPVDSPRRHIPLALPVSGIAVENEPQGLAVRLFNSPARFAMRLAFKSA